jgi:ribose transport system permease protein
MSVKGSEEIESTTMVAPESQSAWRTWRHRIDPATVAAYVLAGVIFVGATIYNSGFASGGNIRQILIFSALLGIAALGETLVILGGGMDLSVPSVITFAGITIGKFTGPSHWSGVAGISLLVVIGAVIGLVNGIGVTKFRIPPIIMTLAVGGLVTSYVEATGSLQSTASGVPGVVKTLAQGKIGPVPLVVILWIVLAILTGIVLRHTPFGRFLFAVGSNPIASNFAGIQVARTRITTYVISGCASVVAGILLAGYLGTSYLSMGTPYLFGSIAAVALGGAVISGGRGSYWGTVAGALTLTLLTGVLPLLHLNTDDLDIVYGLVILGGVVLAREIGQRRYKGKVES